MSEQVNSPQGEPVATEAQQTANSEKMYGAKAVHELVDSRLKQQAKNMAEKYEAEKADLLAELERRTPSKNAEDEYKQKLSRYENEKKALSDKLQKMHVANAKANVRSTLSQLDCYDPEDVTELMFAKGLLEIDKDGEVRPAASGIYGTTEECVKDFLGRKPHYVKRQTSGGLGTAGPTAPAANFTGDFNSMSREQLRNVPLDQIKAAVLNGLNR